VAEARLSLEQTEMGHLLVHDECREPENFWIPAAKAEEELKPPRMPP
jgi:hypothetical protein